MNVVHPSSLKILQMVEKKYPQPKDHDLTENEKEQIRERIRRGQADIYLLAREFHCSPSQIAGIKAAMSRTS